MAKRVLIIYRVDAANASNNGVIKKLDGQAKGFAENGWVVDSIRIFGSDILLNDEPIKKLSKSKFGAVVFEFFQSIGKAIDLSKYKMLYIRYGLSFSGFISFLKNVKEKNPAIKILLEFATFPYTEEWTGAKGLLVKKVDGHYRKRLSKYVDHVIHLGEETEILGMRCINTENGIDLSEIKIRNKEESPNSLNLLAVGKWQFWHGLDRLMIGISKENNREAKKVSLIIVGEGPAISDLKSLKRELGLDSEVSFVGEKVGEELNRLYDSSDIGIGTLGMHRKNIKVDSSLKHREYASKGLPFILCTKDKDFPVTLKFVKYYEESEEPMDIPSLRSFAEAAMKVSSEEIRSYAETKLSWTVKISRILDEVG